MYAIVDIETTGGLTANNRITEVAVLVHDGYQIVEEFQTLINPGRLIPGYITGLTGISSETVQNAPFFSEIAENLFDLLSDKIFVAHNVNFDYNFLKEEFKRVGKVFNRPKLCTVRLSRQVFPGLKSYSLGRICDHNGIEISDRHRAFGDAAATAQLFESILAKGQVHVSQALKRNSGAAFLPPHISMEKYQGLPEEAGVYYFHDAHGQVIYVGKAMNIRSRFKGHFSESSHTKSAMKTEICDISFELTGSGFLALLLEALEIKRLWPKYNRALKVKALSWGIFQYEDNAGYQRLQIGKNKVFHQPIQTFTSHAEAWSFILAKIKEFRLCPKLCGVQKSPKACYDFQQQKCEGACCGEESQESYNHKIDQLLHSLNLTTSKILIREKGRGQEEQAAILFDNGLLSAYGFIDKTVDFSGTEEVVSCLKKVKSIPETNYILRSYLANTKAEVIAI